MSDSLQPHEPQHARPLCPWDSPGKNTGVGCHALLQGNPGIELTSLKFPAPGGGYFTTSATRKDGQVGEASIITGLFEGVIE